MTQTAALTTHKRVDADVAMHGQSLYTQQHEAELRAKAYEQALVHQDRVLLNQERLRKMELEHERQERQMQLEHEVNVMQLKGTFAMRLLNSRSFLRSNQIEGLMGNLMHPVEDVKKSPSAKKSPVALVDAEGSVAVDAEGSLAGTPEKHARVPKMLFSPSKVASARGSKSGLGWDNSSGFPLALVDEETFVARPSEKRAQISKRKLPSPSELAAEDAARKAVEEAAAKAVEEEVTRKLAEEDAPRKAAEEAALKPAQAEAAKKVAEEEAAAKAAEEAAQKLVEGQEAAKKIREDVVARFAAEELARKVAEDFARKAEEEEMARELAEEEAVAEAARMSAEEHAAREAAEEATKAASARGSPSALVDADAPVVGPKKQVQAAIIYPPRRMVSSPSELATARTSIVEPSGTQAQVPQRKMRMRHSPSEPASARGVGGRKTLPSLSEPASAKGVNKRNQNAVPLRQPRGPIHAKDPWAGSLRS